MILLRGAPLREPSRARFPAGLSVGTGTTAFSVIRASSPSDPEEPVMLHHEISARPDRRSPP